MESVCNRRTYRNLGLGVLRRLGGETAALGYGSYRPEAQSRASKGRSGTMQAASRSAGGVSTNVSTTTVSRQFLPASRGNDRWRVDQENAESNDYSFMKRFNFSDTKPRSRNSHSHTVKTDQPSASSLTRFAASLFWFWSIFGLQYS